ncbi:hypothetical protein TIFTF001_055794 [Ficus carica]|uniref:Uncharacterized protein n=1 Tax=Ficus carica TaxID=3494 RepID=A0AA88EJ39_FICCA|nr:hypothetical protein TIFTF001_055794 [Ficus carica]
MVPGEVLPGSRGSSTLVNKHGTWGSSTRVTGKFYPGQQACYLGKFYPGHGEVLPGTTMSSDAEVAGCSMIRLELGSRGPGYPGCFARPWLEWSVARGASVSFGCSKGGCPTSSAKMLMPKTLTAFYPGHGEVLPVTTMSSDAEVAGCSMIRLELGSRGPGYPGCFARPWLEWSVARGASVSFGCWKGGCPPSRAKMLMPKTLPAATPNVVGWSDHVWPVAPPQSPTK